MRVYYYGPRAREIITEDGRSVVFVRCVNHPRCESLRREEQREKVRSSWVETCLAADGTLGRRGFLIALTRNYNRMCELRGVGGGRRPGVTNESVDGILEFLRLLPADIGLRYALTNTFGMCMKFNRHTYRGRSPD